MTEERTITSDDFQALVSRMRIRHIEEVERMTGKPLDQIFSIPEVGVRAHAIAYVIAVDANPEATWADTADEPIIRLAEAPAEDPTPLPSGDAGNASSAASPIAERP